MKAKVNQLLQKVCNNNNWSVSAEKESEGYHYYLSTTSPKGQDVEQEFYIQMWNDVDLIEYSLYILWHNFDPEEETMLRVDFDGQGKNGAPSLRDCLADMDWVESQLKEIYENFRHECSKKRKI